MATSPLEVYVRFRPATRVSKDLIVEPNNQNIQTVNPVNGQKLSFTFNYVFQNATQEQIFDKVCLKQVSHCLEGYDAAIIATGQTSAGKSYSIVGDEALTYKTRGMIARSMERIFETAAAQPGTNFEVRFSVVEVLNDKLIDLLAAQSASSQSGVKTSRNTQNIKNTSGEAARQGPQLHEAGGKLQIQNLTSIQLHNVSEGLELLFGAESCKSVGANALNRASSRSHVVYLLTVRQSSRTDESAAMVESRLYLVDLAGSEKDVSD